MIEEYYCVILLRIEMHDGYRYINTLLKGHNKYNTENTYIRVNEGEINELLS